MKTKTASRKSAPTITSFPAILNKNDRYLLAVLLYRVVIIDSAKNYPWVNTKARRSINIKAMNAITHALCHRAFAYPLWWRVMLKLQDLLAPQSAHHIIDRELFALCERCVSRQAKAKKPLSQSTEHRRGGYGSVSNAFHHRALLPHWAKTLLPIARYGSFLFYDQPYTGTLHRYEKHP